MKWHLVLSALFIMAHGGAQAQDTSPVGLWKNIDDESHKPVALIRITQHGAELIGAIEKVFNPKEPNPVCNACTGTDKGKPIVGLTILTGMKKDGDQYAGKILDPKNGKTYRSTLEIIENGQKLKVRGYIAVSWLGRTQIWQRED